MKFITFFTAIGLLLINPGCSKTDQLSLPNYQLYDGQAGRLGHSAVLTSDSTVVLAGYDEGGKILLYETALSGHIKWTSKIESDRGFSNLSLEKSKNGDLFLIGTSRINQGNSKTDILLIKFDAEGRETWRKTYGRSSEEYLCVFTTTKDDNLLIISNSENPQTGKRDLLILKIDKEGNNIWQEIIESQNEEILPYHLLETNSDRGFIISGAFDEDDDDGIFDGLNILKIDSSGQKQWQVKGDKDYEWGFSTTEAINGDLLITGQNTLDGSSQALVYKYDSKGNLLWEKEYGQLGNYQEHGISIKTNFDNTFTILGTVINFGVDRGDIFLFKINSNGEILWSKTFGSDEEDVGINLLKDSYDNNIITGMYNIPSKPFPWLPQPDNCGFLFITYVHSGGEFK
jgi:hypothetical protein